MTRAEAAGDALNEDFGVGFDEYGHVKIYDFRFMIYESTLLLAFLDFFQISNCDPVVISIHCFLRDDQRINVNHATSANWKFQLDRVSRDFVIIANSFDLAETVEDA